MMMMMMITATTAAVSGIFYHPRFTGIAETKWKAQRFVKV